MDRSRISLQYTKVRRSTGGPPKTSGGGGSVGDGPVLWGASVSCDGEAGRCGAGSIGGSVLVVECWW